MTRRQTAILAIVGGVLAAIGVFLPWVTVSNGSINRFGSVTASGIDGDGKYIVIVSVILAVLGFLSLERPTLTKQVLILIGSILVLVVSAHDYLSLSDAITKMGTEHIEATMGTGLYVVLTGGVVALVSPLSRPKAEGEGFDPPS